MTDQPSETQQSELDLSLLTREILLAYPAALFPMSRDATSLEYQWYRPTWRGVMPLDGFHASRSLRAYLRKNQNVISFKLNSEFKATVMACGARDETWISPPIISAFCQLHELGLAHSLTVDLDGENIGGIYGLTLGRAFFGESMYSKATNGSKLALWAMVETLKAEDMMLFDTQYLTPHLASLGGIEIHKDQYQELLEHALAPWPRLEDREGLFSTSGRDFLSLLDRAQVRHFCRTTIDPDIITRMIHS